MRFPKALAAILALGVLCFAADDEFAGTWKVNAEKSKTSSGTPAAGSMTIDAVGDGYRIALSGGATLTLHLDAKDYPREPMGIAKAVGADVVSARRLNRHTIETAFKRDGKTVATVKREVSAAGRMLTATTEGVSVAGEKLHNVVVYDKQ